MIVRERLRDQVLNIIWAQVLAQAPDQVWLGVRFQSTDPLRELIRRQAQNGIWAQTREDLDGN